MDDSQKLAPIRSIVIIGIVATIALMLFSIVGYYLLDNSIEGGKAYASEINISGRQRLLTERIAFLSLLVATDRKEAAKLDARNGLRLDIEEITTASQFLTRSAMSPRLREMYEQPPIGVKGRLDSYIAEVKAFESDPPQAQTLDNVHLAELLNTAPKLVSAWDAVTREYASEGEGITAATQDRELAILVVELLAIVLLAVFVFWPLVRRSRSQIHRLVAVETFNRAILNYMAGGLISIDESGHIALFNPAAERIFGYKPSEVIGKNINLLMPEPYRSEHDTYLKRYCNTEEGHVIGRKREVIGRHHDGSLIPLQLAINEMRIGDKRYFIGNLRDITHEKETQNSLIEAKEKAELANRAKDSFLTTMSHEIRTPLTGMLGMIEVLSLTQLDNEQRRTLQAAWDSGKGLLRIVSDILDWSKIEEGKLSIVARATSIPQLLQEVVNTYSHVASSKNLILKQYADTAMGQAHLVDALRLSQVLNNFVSNAIKFTKQGEVELKAELLERLESGERIRFSVRDTGIGIAQAAQQQLFQRYKQESEDHARLYGGTGLGLAICRRLTDLLDGQIELKSEVGKGSTFSITLVLPLSGAPGESPQLHSEVTEKRITPLWQNQADPPRVLVIDDHPINRDLLSRQIQILGLKAETAENGRSGFDQWLASKFDLIITDCHMPEMDGYGMSREIREAERQQHKATHIPIIGWTANAVGDEAALCRSAGMDDILIKPTHMQQLRDALAKYLNLGESHPPAAHPQEMGSRESSEEPIDYAALAEVMPDRSMHAKVLFDFVKHVLADHIQLSAWLDQEDHIQAERTAHRMKGSSRMVGAKQMANICEAIEHAASHGDMKIARQYETELAAEIKRIEAHLKGVIGRD